MGSFQEDLARRGDADLRAGARDADRAQLDPAGGHGGGQPAVLRLAVHLPHVDAEGQVPSDQLRRDGGSAGDGAAGAGEPQRALDVVEHERVGDPIEEREGHRRPAALEPALGHSHADPDRPAVGELAQRRCLAHAQGHGGIELLPDPRHREEHRRRHFADVLGHGVDALREVHGRARVEGIEDAERALGDVSEGQERQLLIPFARLGDEIGIAELEQNVAVTEHGPLGGTRGARRVHQDGQILGLRDLDEGIEGAGMVTLVARAELEQCLERHHLVVLESVQPVHVVHEDLHELGAAGAHLEDLVELLLVLGEEEARAAVVDDVFHLPRRIRRVDAVGDPAYRDRAEVGVEPLRTVVGHDRHHVAGPQTQRDEPEADMLGPLPVFAPGDGAPDPEALLPHGHLVGPFPHHLAEERG